MIYFEWKCFSNKSGERQSLICAKHCVTSCLNRWFHEVDIKWSAAFYEIRLLWSLIYLHKIKVSNGLQHRFETLKQIRVISTHYNGVIISAMASQITRLTIVYQTFYSGADQRKHQSSVSPAGVRGIHRWPVNSPHKRPVTRKMFPSDDVIMYNTYHSLFASVFLCYALQSTWRINVNCTYFYKTDPFRSIVYVRMHDINAIFLKLDACFSFGTVFVLVVDVANHID